MTLPLFGIVGWKNSGKTTLMTKLVTIYTAHGLRVTAIKHAHHTFDVDHEGRDSFRYRSAGAATVIVASPVRFAVMKELGADPEPSLDDLLGFAMPSDVILVEGYKRRPHPKIEVRRRQAAQQVPLSAADRTIAAIATDFPVDGADVPVFALDAADEIAAFVADQLHLTLRYTSPGMR